MASARVDQKPKLKGYGGDSHMRPVPIKTGDAAN